MASSPLPVMAPELWTIVLESYGSDFEDLIFLWTQCRQVSKQFREDVENIFVRQYLPTITLDIGCQLDVDYYACDFFETEYVGVSKDRKTALFSAPAASQKEILEKVQMTKGNILYGGPNHYAHTRMLTGMIPIPRGFVLREEGKLVFGIDRRELLDVILQEWKRRRDYLVQEVSKSFLATQFSVIVREGFDIEISLLTLARRKSQMHVDPNFDELGCSDTVSVGQFSRLS